jgi:hypothetical protein
MKERKENPLVFGSELLEKSYSPPLKYPEPGGPA